MKGEGCLLPFVVTFLLKLCLFEILVEAFGKSDILAFPSEILARHIPSDFTSSVSVVKLFNCCLNKYLSSILYTADVEPKQRQCKQVCKVGICES